MSFPGVEFGCLFGVCYLSSSVFYTLEKQDCVCTEQSCRKDQKAWYFSDHSKVMPLTLLWLNFSFSMTCMCTSYSNLFLSARWPASKKNLCSHCWRCWEFGKWDEIWRLRKPRYFGTDWLHVTNWIVQPEWENVCCLLYAKIKFWGSEGCSLLLLLSHNRILLSVRKEVS